MAEEFNYQQLRETVSWEGAREELGLVEGGPVNIGRFCTDRNVELGRGDKTAFIHEDSVGEICEYSFKDLAELTNGWTQFLRSIGVEERDRVAIFLERVPELYIGFLGVLKAGAVVQPLFSAFGEEALFQRLENSGAKVVITQRKHVNKVRRCRENLPALEGIVVIDQEGAKKPLNAELGEVAYVQAENRLDSCPPANTFEESPSVLHYTSGTTGQPKGALHAHGSVVAQYLTGKMVLDLKDDDIYWCTADPGWVTGTSYGIIAPWVLGVTQVVLDKGFSAVAWYEFMQGQKVTVWYTAPTAIRMLMKEGVETVKKHDLTPLRHMCSVGEPLNPEAVHWGRDAFRLDFHDTFWQTETGAIMVTNLPGMPVKPGSMGRAFPAVQAGIVNAETGAEITEPHEVGIIAVKPPWPSMMRHYWNNSDKYFSKFIGGWYLCGDRGMFDEDGYIWFSGRDDDVINTGGHLVGPFEIESALLEHEAVAESAAIGKPDPVNMEVVKAFVALKPGIEATEELELKIMNLIRKRLSPLAMPQEIEFVKSLPKTRSGKIMRRLLKAQEWGEEIGDISTLEDD